MLLRPIPRPGRRRWGGVQHERLGVEPDPDAGAQQHLVVGPLGVGRHELVGGRADEQLGLPPPRWAAGWSRRKSSESSGAKVGTGQREPARSAE